MHAGFGGGKIFDVLREKMIMYRSKLTLGGWIDSWGCCRSSSINTDTGTLETKQGLGGKGLDGTSGKKDERFLHNVL